MKNKLFLQISIPIILLVLFIICLVAIYLGDINEQYNNKVEQYLHKDVAKYIISQNKSLNNGTFDKKTLQNLFNNVMSLGTEYEVYLLDMTGKVISYSAKDDEIKLEKIELAPLNTFIRNAHYPIFDSNPKDPKHNSLFSTAIIKNNAGNSIGYLYIVLNSHKKVLSAQKFHLISKILFY